MCASDRGVDDGDVDLVVDDVQHRGHQFGAAGDRRLAGLQIDLHAESFAEVLQFAAEVFQRIAVFR